MLCFAKVAMPTNNLAEKWFVVIVQVANIEDMGTSSQILLIDGTFI